MFFEIKHKISGKVKFSGKFKNFKLCVKAAIESRVDLSYADFSGADCTGADFTGADFTGAIFDFASLPLWCGAFGMVVDDRFVGQLIHHFAKLDVSKCSGGVKEAVEHIKKMAISDLFCEYRHDIKRISEE